MQMGFNNDVSYRGLTVHIQTEDHGLASKKVTSQVFFSGAVLESKTISYADEIEGSADAEERDERVRKFMKALHRKLYSRIQKGAYDSMLPLPQAAESAEHGLEVPHQLIEDAGFSVVSDDVSEGVRAAKSRGEVLPQEAFEPAHLAEELAAVAPDMGPEGFVQLGGVGPSSGDASPERSAPAAAAAPAAAVAGAKRDNSAIQYGTTPAFRGLDRDDSDLGALLIGALAQA